jgi:hypothetical protein
MLRGSRRGERRGGRQRGTLNRRTVLGDTILSITQRRRSMRSSLSWSTTEGCRPISGWRSSRQMRAPRTRSRGPFVIATMCVLLPSKPAWSAAANLATPIICALRRPCAWSQGGDEFTVPLCRGHHRELHRHGNEAGWWEKLGLDPTVAARALWLEAHPEIVEGPLT